jgi:hypothetical protein
MVKMRTSIVGVEVEFDAVEVIVEDEIKLQIKVDVGDAV